MDAAIDDCQFGAACVLNALNHEKGRNIGIEGKATYHNGGFNACANIAWAPHKGTNVVSNQYLFDPDELAYIAKRSVYTASLDRVRRRFLCSRPGRASASR
jgi:hypothetical protein